MRVWGFAALGALLLTGCGDSDAEDFAVEIKRPVEVVYAPLLAADVSEARMVFPGITFQRSRPSDGEILYTIPGSGSFPAFGSIPATHPGPPVPETTSRAAIRSRGICTFPCKPRNESR